MLALQCYNIRLWRNYTGLTLIQILTTYRHIFKAISLLIVTAFLFAQFAAANHTHDHAGEDPAPCAICLTASHNDGDFDIPPSEPVEPRVATLTSYMPLALTEPRPAFKLDNVTAPAPPDIRPSAPRAPPH